jgi:ADP-ribose pyrophosphatase YjhB (NUDIX family)
MTSDMRMGSEMPDPDYEAKYGKGPHLTADAVVVRGNEIALVRRKSSGQWALPGGFLDQGETFSDCAIREFKEEAGVDLRATPGLILGVYRPLAFDAIERDPRSRIISGAVLITLSEEMKRPELFAGDDAEAAQWTRWYAIPKLYADHNTIVEALLAPYRAQEIGEVGEDAGF